MSFFGMGGQRNMAMPERPDFRGFGQMQNMRRPDMQGMPEAPDMQRGFFGGDFGGFGGGRFRGYGGQQTQPMQRGPMMPGGFFGRYGQ